MPRAKTAKVEPQPTTAKRVETRTGDDVLQFRDAALKARIERRVQESGAGSMVEVVRRILTIGITIDELLNPGDRIESEDDLRRAMTQLRAVRAVVNDLHDRLASQQTHAAPAPAPPAQTPRHQPVMLDDDSDDIPIAGGRSGML